MPDHLRYLGLWERLAPDDEPASARRPSPDTLRDGVKAQIEALLNARGRSDFDKHPRVARSVINYGLHNLAGGGGRVSDIKRLTREIETAVQVFEPRVEAVKVEIDETMRPRSGVDLHLTIRGRIKAQPDPIPLSLSSNIDTETGQVTLYSGGGQTHDR